MADRIDTPRALGNHDAPHESPVTPSEDIRTVVLNQISWSAVFAGVVAALAVQIVLNLIGVGIGAATLDPGTADNPDAGAFSVGAALWWTISGIIASAIGGYVAGRSCGKPKESTGGLHGFTSWATATLAIFFLLSSTLGAMMGGMYESVSDVVDQTIEEAVPGVQTAPGANAQNQAAPGANQQAAPAPAPTPEAKQEATEAADTAASAVSTGSIFAGLALILGALAAWLGGRAGTVYPTITTLSVAAGERRR